MSDQTIATETTNAEVGYKRPPVKSRFRKGQSGNPRGRRRGQRNLAPVLREVLAQTVKVKRNGKTEHMNKGEALIQVLLSKAQAGDARAIKALLQLTEKIARINAPEPRPAGPGNYEFMLVPGVAASREEYVRETRMREELAEIRNIVRTAEARGKFLSDSQRTTLRGIVEAARAAGTKITASQLDWLKETLASPTPPRPMPSPVVTRRPVNRRSACDPNLQKCEQQTNEASAVAAETASVQPAVPNSTTPARTPTYRKVNRRQPPSP